jgi:bifunctional UDP-N-acetylglucosamine pyrophosphorylase/glucosamine-1-phosphate N-acetyltransferase
LSLRAVVLAAGKGTRMKSARPKVLHDICGRPMIWYVLASLRAAGIEEIVLVTNDELDPHAPAFGVKSVIQREQLGTGHAVRVALDAMDARPGGKIVVAYGDMPLVPDATFRALLGALDTPRGTGGVSLALVTARMGHGSNFGRVVRDGTGVRRIVEVKDATPHELAIEEMNAGIYAYDEAALRESILHLRNDNAQKEYYLTDTIAHLADAGHRVAPIAADKHDVLGVNDRTELAVARATLNGRICAAHMRCGVTIIDPLTTYLEPELTIGRDTVIYPNTSISLLSEIGTDCVLGPNARLSAAKLGDRVTVRESVIVESEVGNDVTIGPYAHLRGHAVLGNDVKVGNFVEIKNSELADGAKASHLSYLGDATIGEETNVGAGTITANFDGEKKNRTTIGKNVRIGSNSSLIAPVTIGDGALTGAGAVVTKDVAPGARVVGNPARPLPKK